MSSTVDKHNENPECSGDKHGGGSNKNCHKGTEKAQHLCFLNVIQNHFDPVFEKIISSNMSFVQYLEYSLSDGLDERRHQNVPEPNWSIDKEDSPVHR